MRNGKWVFVSLGLFLAGCGGFELSLPPPGPTPPPQVAMDMRVEPDRLRVRVGGAAGVRVVLTFGRTVSGVVYFVPSLVDAPWVSGVEPIPPEVPVENVRRLEVNLTLQVAPEIPPGTYTLDLRAVLNRGEGATLRKLRLTVEE